MYVQKCHSGKKVLHLAPDIGRSLDKLVTRSVDGCATARGTIGYHVLSSADGSFSFVPCRTDLGIVGCKIGSMNSSTKWNRALRTVFI